MMSEQVEIEIIGAALQFRRRLDEIADNLDRPSVRFRPTISLDGDTWIALYGENLAVGVVGVGDSPEEAMRDFDSKWYKKVEKQSNERTIQRKDDTMRHTIYTEIRCNWYIDPEHGPTYEVYKVGSNGVKAITDVSEDNSVCYLVQFENTDSVLIFHPNQVFGKAVPPGPLTKTVA